MLINAQTVLTGKLAEGKDKGVKQTMYQHHQSTLDALAAQLQSDEDVIALLLAGSIAKGWHQESSDVDVMIVNTDQAYEGHVAKHEVAYFDRQIATYEGGYIDGKYINKQFLYDVISHGSEVAKSAFLGAKIVFSRDDEIIKLVEQICAYPEAEREAKMRSFVAQVMLWRWYVSEAEKRQDRYLLLQSVSELVLFGSRLMLAYNRLIYPYHKWLRRQLEQAKDLPDNYFALMDAALEHPSFQTANAYAEALLQFQDWDVSLEQAIVLFLHDREWNWREAKAPIHDW